MRLVRFGLIKNPNIFNGFLIRAVFVSIEPYWVSPVEAQTIIYQIAREWITVDRVEVSNAGLQFFYCTADECIASRLFGVLKEQTPCEAVDPDAAKPDTDLLLRGFDFS